MLVSVKATAASHGRWTSNLEAERSHANNVNSEQKGKRPQNTLRNGQRPGGAMGGNDGDEQRDMFISRFEHNPLPLKDSTMGWERGTVIRVQEHVSLIEGRERCF